jgi:translation initiation factor eaIF-5B
VIKFLDGENLKLNSFHRQLKNKNASIQTDLDQKLYDVVGTLSILGYKSEAFYRIEDFKSEIAIVPISARSGVGIPELLSVLVGLTQQYLQKRLDQEEKEPRGIILEVKDEVGLGQTANVILIDGTIKKENSIVVAKRDGVIVTKPKALLLPKPLDEMRDPRDKIQTSFSSRCRSWSKNCIT